MGYDFKNMVFLSYQYLKMEKDGEDIKENFNMGQLRTKTILSRQQCLVDRLGYNPYWAVGGKNTKDLILGSFFCAPHNPIVAHIFTANEYTRINKIKHELSDYDDASDNSLDFTDDTCSDICSEFLVKEMNDAVAFFLPVLLCYKKPDFHITDGFIIGDSFKKLDKTFLEEWNQAVRECCYFVFNNMSYQINDDSGIEKESIEYFLLLQNAKIVFEMTILPIILNCLSLKNKSIQPDAEITISTLWADEMRYSFRQLVDLHMVYISACQNKALNNELYESLIEKGYQCIIENTDLLEVFTNKRVYPNDLCPCGSGEKYKKCHGRINLKKSW